jgi:hypothetical protein
MSPVSSMASSLVTFTSVPLAHWQPATWADYLRLRDSSPEGSVSLFFQSEYLLTVMGEGINHSRFVTTQDKKS